MANQPSKYSKFLIGAASAALVASAVAPVASAADFKDTKGNTHEAAIDALSDAGVISGYPDGTFLPNKTLTRSDVVKLMGKWLVSEGSVVPTDYKTNMRFTDLKSTSNDELLKYAAVVKDNGVFVGTPDGKLDATGDITRENMAVVLVRAFDRVHDIDLTTYVAGQDFKKDVTDLGKAKAEARPAIDVLDFFDITNPAAPAFNPKATTSRGQFATFLYKTTKADFSDVSNGAVVGVAGVKAVNATTVEVTFKDAVENINSLNFKIDGLTVSNAAVKQTDAKTVVLTTAVQKGGEKYTVTLNGKAIGSFNGVSAVIPSTIKMTQQSLQGKVGQQVILSADIGVKEAGVPVTFNVNAGSDTTLNPQMVGEAITNADGIATYSYTRYAGTTDTVTAYPTGNPAVRSSASVYWNSSLTVSEVTVGNVLANGAKKVYKINTSNYATAYDAAGKELYNYVNVAFAENVNVSPDKLVRGVSINDTGVTTNASYPSQVTTGGVNEVRVKVNAAGEATFTLSGASAAVTPVVFVDADKNGKWSATELQAAAPTVKFDLSHTLGLTVKAEGVQNAAAINANGIGNGGRTYTATVTDKDGKLAPEGTLVHVAFPEGSFSTDRDIYFTSSSNGTTQIVKDALYTAKVGKEGKTTFTLTGKKDGFAEPTVFINNGSDDAKLDKSDLQTVGEKTFFVNAVINNAELVAEVNGNEVTTTSGSNTVSFIYTSVDQNGKNYVATTPNYEVSYEVTAQFGDVYAGPANTLVKKGTTSTIKINAISGVATLNVKSVDPSVASQVTVNASASQVSLPNKAVTVNFTNSLTLPAIHKGYVTNLDTTNERIKLDNYNPVSYAGGTFFNALNQPLGKADFVAALQGVSAGNKAEVTATRQADGSYKFNIINLAVPQTPAELFAEAQAKLVAKKAEVAAKEEATYTPASWISFTTAKTTADNLPAATTAEINTKTAAYNSAIALLVTKASEEGAQAVATLRLNNAKAAATSKTAEAHTAGSWTTFQNAVNATNGTAFVLPEVTANQKVAKAIAYENAVNALVGKSSFANFTFAVNEATATNGKLVLTFTETSATPVTGFVVGPVSNVTGAVAGTVATAAPAGTPDTTVTITVTDGATTPAAIDLTAAANQGDTYTFTATVSKTDFFAKDVVVEVKYNPTAINATTGAWVATVK